MYLGSPPDNEFVDPLDWPPEKFYWLGQNEALSGSCEYYRGALREISGDFPFTQPPLKVVQLGFQIADDQRRLPGRGYDGRVVRVEG
jgi:hypothetical protein